MTNEIKTRKWGGRPKGSKGGHTLKAELMRKRLILSVNKEYTPIVQGQIQLAKGLFYEDKTKEGTRIVYREKPDGRAAEYLLNQSIGKPRENMEITGADKGPIAIKLNQ